MAILNPRVRRIQLHSRTAVLQPLNIFRGCSFTWEKGDRSVTTSEAQRLRSIARELEAEADLTDPAAMEWAEAYARLAEAAESSEPDEKGHEFGRSGGER